MAEVKRYVTPVFRGAFAKSVFKAESYDGGEPKYGITAVWDPSTFKAKDKERWNAIKKALDEEAKTRFKKSSKDLPANIKRGLCDGAEKADLEGFGEGTMFASLTTKMRPGVVDWEKNPVSIEEGNTDLCYSGALYRATVTVYSYDNKGKGVSLGLMNLQVVCADEARFPRMDGRTDAAEDFEDDLDDAWLEQEEDDEAPF